MLIVTKPIREQSYYEIRIVAVGAHDEGKFNCPAIEFLVKQNSEHPQMLRRLTALLKNAATYRPLRNEQKFRALKNTDGIFEFKAGQLRLFCFWDEGDLLVCTNGTVKKKQRTDSTVIETALHWKNSYFEAKRNNLLKHEPEHDRIIRVHF
jgi:hypothetical protein